jgi:hypothetical protein
MEQITSLTSPKVQMSKNEHDEISKEKKLKVKAAVWFVLDSGYQGLSCS